MNELPHREITERVIGCAFRVHTQLGHGFLERVYENAMGIELKKEGLRAQRISQKKIQDIPSSKIGRTKIL